MPRMIRMYYPCVPRSDKNAGSWSVDKLKVLLTGLEFSGKEGKGSLTIEGVWLMSQCVVYREMSYC